jgi:hypothetical protein
MHSPFFVVLHLAADALGLQQMAARAVPRGPAQILKRLFHPVNAFADATFLDQVLLPWVSPPQINED